MFIVRIVAAIVIFYLLYRMAKWLFHSSVKTADPLPTQKMPEKTEDLVEDPCCHAYLPVSQAYKATLDGKTVCFCSRECYEKYRQISAS
ncbi:MAG: hypothetical protein A4E68_00603 [Syntrophaceae bacterium PtaB.Bin095]|jgi:YHS domain-containing protein|nr:MAG: hypothetical protein A4E68_00603 [Syntrophaceae bacterium PtaB.Bin095]